MSDYRKVPPTIEDFPLLDVADCEDYANKLFTPYLFFKKERDHIKLTCSCCRKSGRMDYVPRTITTVEQMILEGEHNYWAVCPYCAREMQMKNISRLGKRKKLLEYHPIVFMCAKNGDLYCRAYWARKDYQGDFADPPLLMLTDAYHFTLGRATVFYEPYNQTKLDSRSIEGNYDPVHRVITEPFTNGNNYMAGYLPYAIYGIEAIQKTDFKYCCYDNYVNQFQAKWGTETLITHYDAMKFFAACSIYPRQIEMLMKCGFKSIVIDLVTGRCKNSRVFNWKETDFKKAFGLSKQEIKEWQESKADTACIRIYKMMKRAKLQDSIREISQMSEMYYASTLEDMARLGKKHHKRLSAVVKYIEKQQKGQKEHCEFFFKQWKDYLDMAETLGWDITDETVAFPKNLRIRHDEAVAEHNLLLERKKSEAEAESIAAAQESLEKRRLKYNIELGDCFIRVAETPAEIRAEGRILKHCVGGYAERHMKGTTTILFLRHKDAPNTPLYTIEMHDNTLRQIHGYKNDAGAESPRVLMSWMLEPWLLWIKKGSKRDKNGKPKLPSQKKEKAA